MTILSLQSTGLARIGTRSLVDSSPQTRETGCLSMPFSGRRHAGQVAELAQPTPLPGPEDEDTMVIFPSAFPG